MLIPKILYIVSGTLWALETIPQIVRTYKRKTVGDISLFFPLLCFISFLCFLTASFMVKNWILLYTHIFPFICNIIFLSQVLIYGRKKWNVNVANEK